MPVTPEVQTILDLINAAEVPRHELSPTVLREQYLLLNMAASKLDMASVRDLTFPGPAGDVPLRVYVPTSEPGPRPALVYFHGGGWVIGDIETHDGTVRSLADASGVTCVSVGYRRAPEDPFPAAFDDCVAAVRWVVDNAADLDIDPSRVAVGGDSAGGNLAAAAAIELRDTPVDVRFQLLVYPVTDGSMDQPSLDENAEGYFLTKDTMAWFWDLYAADAPRTDPRLSPMDATDDALRGVAPLLVITAEYDPLRDEGERYAERMRAAGVPVELTRYDGMAHGFFTMSGVLPDARRAIAQAARFLRETLVRQETRALQETRSHDA
jgi:acetyl esterase